MGVVYEAEQLDLRRRVAVKVLHEVEPRAVERFMQEALATANLASPNVVTVLEFSPGGGGEPPFLVMELLSGEVLFSLLKRAGALPVARAVGIAAQVLAGLGAAHRAGIVHRDIKPSNVFLVPTVAGGDLVKVLDFGIAKVLDGEGMLTTTGSLLGTPAYFAPEQLRHEPADARTDLHAVGACLYEMLAAHRPWRATGPALTAEILRDLPIPLSRADVPPGLVAVIERALAKDRAQRFASAEEMIDALRPWMNATDETRRGVPQAPVERQPSQSPPVVPQESNPTPAVRGDRHEAENRAIMRVVLVAVIALALVLVSIRLGPRLLAKKVAAPETVASSAMAAPVDTSAAVAAPLAPAPSAFPTAAASAPAEIDGCYCVYEEMLPKYDAGPACRTILCNEPEELRCACAFSRAFGVHCKVPFQRGHCPAGKEWTGREIVPKDVPCVAYRRFSGGEETKDEQPAECSACYTAKTRPGTPDEICYAYDPQGNVRAGRWKCGPRALAVKPLTGTCAFPDHLDGKGPITGSGMLR
jgi:eukaryotic-like serine/threonine-protein kinase